MNDITITYPFKDVPSDSSSSYITNAWANSIRVLNFFDDLVLQNSDTAIWTYIHDGTLLLNCGGRDRYVYIGVNDTDRQLLWPVNTPSYYYNGGFASYLNNMRTIYMYNVNYENTAGFWYDDSRRNINYHPKLFITKVIDEVNDTEDITFLYAVNYGRNDSNNVCKIYPYGNVSLSLLNHKIANAESGMSNTFVMRQLRYMTYLFPDVYIISGGLFESDRDVVTIDNNTYIHMCNDIYVKLS